MAALGDHLGEIKDSEDKRHAKIINTRNAIHENNTG
jgi:hypothetical protein